MDNISKLDQKREKAKAYASQPERFKIRFLQLEMQSTHGTRHITCDKGFWLCTCDFFREEGTCSHIMAAQEILEDRAQLTSN